MSEEAERKNLRTHPYIPKKRRDGEELQKAKAQATWSQNITQPVGDLERRCYARRRNLGRNLVRKRVLDILRRNV
jgi:hypothetical protein